MFPFYPCVSYNNICFHLGKGHHHLPIAQARCSGVILKNSLSLVPLQSISRSCLFFFPCPISVLLFPSSCCHPSVYPIVSSWAAAATLAPGLWLLLLLTPPNSPCSTQHHRQLSFVTRSTADPPWPSCCASEKSRVLFVSLASVIGTE